MNFVSEYKTTPMLAKVLTPSMRSNIGSSALLPSSMILGLILKYLDIEFIGNCISKVLIFVIAFSNPLMVSNSYYLVCYINLFFDKDQIAIWSRIKEHLQALLLAPYFYFKIWHCRDHCADAIVVNDCVSGRICGFSTILIGGLDLHVSEYLVKYWVFACTIFNLELHKLQPSGLQHPPSYLPSKDDEELLQEES